MITYSKMEKVNKDSLYDFPMAAASVIEISVEKITPNRAQPRKTFTDSALESLADSISRHGVLQPLLVRKTGDRFELIAGERRLRASIMAGLREVPCIIKESDERDSAQIAIIENLQREDLNMFEEAEAIRALIDTCGLTQESAATQLSCSQSYIANKLRLLKLPELQRHAILECGLTERHARALLRLRDNDERADAIALIIKRRLNVAATEEYIEALLCERERTEAAEKNAKIERDFKKRLLTRDMRLFYNSIDRAVESVRDCGFAVEASREARDDGTVISIFVRNRRE